MLDLQKQASKYYWYHSVDLGNGVITDGDYDIREVLPHYGFPERMDGMDAGGAAAFLRSSSSGEALR